MKHHIKFDYKGTVMDYGPLAKIIYEALKAERKE